MRLREPRRTLDTGVVRVEIAVTDVVADAGVEEQRVLRDDADFLAQAMQPDFRYVDSID